MTYVPLHQLNPFPGPVPPWNDMSDPNIVRGNDNQIQINFNAHDADATIHLTGGATGGTLTFGTHLTSAGSSFNGSANVTITSDATSANTVSTIVARDGSGNFSAGTVSAALTGNVTGNLTGTVLTATQASITTMANLTTVGALAAGSIAAGFGNINNAANSLTTGALVATSGAFSGLLSANLGLAVSGGTVGQGRVVTDGTFGLAIEGASGATYDFSILKAAAGFTVVMGVTTGTVNVVFGGNITNGASALTTGALTAATGTFSGTVKPSTDATLNLGVTATNRWATGYFSNAVRVEGAGAVVTQMAQASLLTQADAGQWNIYNTAGGLTGQISSHFQWLSSGSKTALAIISGAALELYSNSSTTVGITLDTSNNTTLAGQASALGFQANAVGGGLAASVRYIDGGGTSVFWQINSPTGGGLAHSINGVNQLVTTAGLASFKGDVEIAAAHILAFNNSANNNSAQLSNIGGSGSTALNVSSSLTTFTGGIAATSGSFSTTLAVAGVFTMSNSILFGLDLTYNIGGVGANRPANIYSGTLTTGALTATTGTFSGNVHMTAVATTAAVVTVESISNGYEAVFQHIAKTSGGVSNTWTVGMNILGGSNAIEWHDGTATRMTLAVGGGLTIAQTLGVTGATAFSKEARLQNTTTAGLTAAATAGAGALAFVTDSTSTAILGLGLAVTGGGANKVVVYSDGTNWIII